MAQNAPRQAARLAGRFSVSSCISLISPAFITSLFKKQVAPWFANHQHFVFGIEHDVSSVMSKSPSASAVSQPDDNVSAMTTVAKPYHH